MLGRCHAALGQDALAVAALDAASALASANKFLLSSALVVKARSQVAERAASSGTGVSSGLHWSEYERKQRQAEAMGRMQGPGELHEKLLLG